MEKSDKSVTPDIESRLDELERRIEQHENRISGENCPSDEDGEDQGDSGLGPGATRRGVLTAGGVLAALGLGAGTASGDPQGTIGTSSNPLETLYTEAIDGGVTGDTAVTNLVGTGLSITNGELTTDVTSDTHTNVSDDGATVVSDVGDINFGTDLSVTDDTDGTVTVDASTDIAHADLTNVGASDHHARPSAGDGITDSSNTFDIGVSDFAGSGLADDGSNNLQVSSGGVGTTELNTPFVDLATLFGSPVTAGGNLDLGGNKLTNTASINGSVTGNTEITDLVGSGLSINSGSLEATGDNTWADGDGNDLLEPSGSATGIEVSDVQTDTLTDNGSGDVTVGSTLDVNANDLVDGGTTIWDSTGGHIEQSALENASLTVAGNSVSLGGSTGVDHADLGAVGASDHHTRPSAGDGLTDNANTFDVSVSDFAGTALADDGSNNLQVASGGIGTAELNTPFADLATLFGSPVTAGGNLDLGGNKLTNTASINGSVTGNTEITDLVGSGLTINSGSLEATGSGLWTDSGDDGLLNPADAGDDGIGVTNVQADNLTDNGSGSVTMGNTLDLSGNNLETSSGGLTVTTNNNGNLTLNPGSGNNLVLSNQQSNDASILTIDGSGNVGVGSKSIGDIGGGSSSTLVTGGSSVTALEVLDGGTSVSASSDGATAPNILGGHPSNNTGGTTVEGVTIFGGGDSANNYDNEASDNWSTVSGGRWHTASGLDSTIGGGFRNTSTGTATTVAGGKDNDATGEFATVPGGENNTADGKYSFAAGRAVDTNGNAGAFVWGDSSTTGVTATASDSARFQVPGGFAIQAGGLTVEDGNIDLSGNNLETSTGGLTVTTNNNGNLTLNPGSGNNLVFSNTPSQEDSVLTIDGSGNVGTSSTSSSEIQSYTGAGVYRSTDQSLGSADTDIVVEFDTVQFDTGNAFSTANHTFTAPQDGYYSVDANITVIRNTTDNYAVKLQVNGSDLSGARVECTNTEQNGSLGRTVFLNNGDTIRVVVRLFTNNSSDLVQSDSSLSIDLEGS